MANVPYRLQLMIGPGVPVPVGRDVMEALSSVQVTSNTEGASGFQLTFSLPTSSPLHTLFLLGGGIPIPLVRVVIAVVVGGSIDVLMDGVMTNHQMAPGDNGRATLTIIGEDLSRVMGYLPLNGLPYPAQPPHVRVLSCLAKYMFLGIVPMVIPTLIPDISIPTDRFDAQQGTDLEYVRLLAEQAGYQFYVDPGPMPLMSTAYWGPSIRIGVPQHALNVNMDVQTNVETLTFAYDSESATLPIVLIYPKETKVPIPIPIPNVNPLSPPLGAIPPIPKHYEIDFNSARLSPAAALLTALAKASKTADAASATGTLDVVRYGHVLKSRGLVGVRGAGTAFDGLYFVKSVTHKIKRGEYKQDFSLIRNGLVSITPRVPA
jgi:hypothetical protein